MPASKIAIFYATESKMLRGVLVPDDDEHLKRCYAPEGETMLIVDAFPGSFIDERGRADLANRQYVVDQVIIATGVTPPDPACAVVDDNGMVIGMICADETIDRVLGKQLVQSYDPEITTGCTFDSKTREFIVPEKTIPASLDKAGRAVPEVTLPAKRLGRLKG